MDKKTATLITLIAIIILFGLAVLKNSRGKIENINLNKSLPKNMFLQSKAFGNNEKIPAQYTCDGANINPPLAISAVPADAKSLVITVNDPDAPGGSWLHWSVWNIDPGTREITEDSTPAGASEGETDFGTAGYGGPCPSSGVHRYFFQVYALDVELNVESGAKLPELESAMHGHIIDETTLIGLYGRK